MERHKQGVMWLNFLYSFFGLEIVVKGYFAIGTMMTIISSVKGNSIEVLFSLANFLSFFVCLLFLCEVVIKLLACLSHARPEGYSLMIVGLAVGTAANFLYVLSDQGLIVGIVFAIISGGYFYLNYIYIRNRKRFFGDPDLN